MRKYTPAVTKYVTYTCSKCSGGYMEHTGQITPGIALSYFHKCNTCGATEHLEYDYPRFEHAALLVEDVPPDVEPTPLPLLGSRAANAAFIYAELEKHTDPQWACNWHSKFEKFVPYYDHISAQFGVISSTNGQAAPHLWYRPKPAWLHVIRRYPAELKLFMGIQQ